MSERVPLSFLLTQNAGEEPPVEPTVPFAAMFEENVKICTAVLDRTAVLSEPSDRYERISARHDEVLVDPTAIVWRTRTSEYDGSRLLRGRAPGTGEAHRHRPASKSPWVGRTSVDLKARAKSDERAVENQQHNERIKQRELATQRQQSLERKKEEEPVVSIETTQRTKVCVTCKKEKPESDFPRGLLRPGRQCMDCKGPVVHAIEASIEAREAGAIETTVGEAGPETVVLAGMPPKPKRKYTRRANGKKPAKTATGRREKKVSGDPVSILKSATLAVGAHENIVQLLQKRESLRSQLADVQAQLQEAIAG